MPKVAPEPWISITEIAKHLGVHEESVRRWIKGNRMPASKIGKVWRFQISAVDTWVKTGRANPKVSKPMRKSRS
jgi:excisionase family DNA binding protein